MKKTYFRRITWANENKIKPTGEFGPFIWPSNLKKIKLNHLMIANS